MKMKQSLFLLIGIVLLFSVIVSGCGNPNNEGTEPSAAPSNQQESTTDSESNASEEIIEPIKINIQSDRPVLSTGPNGNTATAATTLELTVEDIKKIKEGNYTAAIALHFAGNDWSSTQARGLQETFAKMGIEVVAVTDANFKSEKQVSDIETVLAKNPDIMVSIPVDPVSTAPAYKKAAEQGVKLVFMDNIPQGFKHNEDFVSIVSADNYGNGVVAAEIMGEHLAGKGKIGVLYFDADFFVTNQRTEAFEKTIAEKYPDIEIIERSGFTDANDTFSVANAMLTKHSDLDGIFAVWDLPAEGVLSAVRQAGREDDLVITTIDLGKNAALNIAKGGAIKGLGAQRPYDQGVAEAILAGYSLLGKETPPYVALPALKVVESNVQDAWKQVYYQDAPQEIQEAVK